jgi:hypothetical protein
LRCYRPHDIRERYCAPLPRRSLTAYSRETVQRHLTPDERLIVAFIERTKGRKLTPQVINLCLEQGRHIGELR